MKVLQTLNGHVLVRPRDTTVKASGIEIPDSVDKGKATVGEVVLDGGKLNDSESQFTKGQLISFGGLAHRKIMHDGEECLLVNSEDIYAILED